MNEDADAASVSQMAPRPTTPRTNVDPGGRVEEREETNQRS